MQVQFLIADTTTDGGASSTHTLNTAADYLKVNPMALRAALSMENPECSCKLTALRTHSSPLRKCWSSSTTSRCLPSNQCHLLRTATRFANQPPRIAPVPIQFLVSPAAGAADSDEEAREGAFGRCP